MNKDLADINNGLTDTLNKIDYIDSLIADYINTYIGDMDLGAAANDVDKELNKMIEVNDDYEWLFEL